MPADTPLGRYLRERWATLAISQADFARRIDARSSYVYLVRTGQRKPPLDHHQVWVQALELSGTAASDRLLELMRLGHAPREIQERYEEMRAVVVAMPQAPARPRRARSNR